MGNKENIKKPANWATPREMRDLIDATFDESYYRGVSKIQWNFRASVSMHDAHIPPAQRRNVI